MYMNLGKSMRDIFVYAISVAAVNTELSLIFLLHVAFAVWNGVLSKCNNLHELTLILGKRFASL